MYIMAHYSLCDFHWDQVRLEYLYIQVVVKSVHFVVLTTLLARTFNLISSLCISDVPDDIFIDVDPWEAVVSVASLVKSL